MCRTRSKGIHKHHPCLVQTKLALKKRLDFTLSLILKSQRNFDYRPRPLTRDLEERQTDLGIKFQVTQSQSPAHWSFMISWYSMTCSQLLTEWGEKGWINTETSKVPETLDRSWQCSHLQSQGFAQKHSAGKSRSLKSDHGKKWPTLAWFNMFNEVTSSGSDLFEILSQGASVRSSSGSQHPSICSSLDLLHSSSFCPWTNILSKQRRNELKRTETN